MSFEISKTPLSTPGREPKANPYLPVVEHAVLGTTYEDIMGEAEGKAAVTLLRRAAAHHSVGLAVKLSEPNSKGDVKVLFRTQVKKQRAPKSDPSETPPVEGDTGPAAPVADAAA